MMTSLGLSFIDPGLWVADAGIGDALSVGKAFSLSPRPP
jgi:hypothetical protein